MPVCKKCGTAKPVEAFRKPFRTCKACQIAYNTEWKRKNPEKVKGYYKPRYCHAWNLRKKYGMSIDEFDSMLERQNSKCPICSKVILANGTKRLHVDHTTVGDQIVVRALLCPECNKGLGLFYDRPDLLRAAANYLEGFNG